MPFGERSNENNGRTSVGLIVGGGGEASRRQRADNVRSEACQSSRRRELPVYRFELQTLLQRSYSKAARPVSCDIIEFSTAVVNSGYTKTFGRCRATALSKPSRGEGFQA